MHDQQKETREDLLKKTDEELRTLMMQSLVSEEIDMEYINCITDIPCHAPSGRICVSRRGDLGSRSPGQCIGA